MQMVAFFFKQVIKSICHDEKLFKAIGHITCAV
jgi:hypothetical protein